MKTTFGALMGAFALVLAAGCSGGEKQPAPDASNPTKGGAEFKVALLTPGPVTDAGWSAMAYTGLKDIEKELGAKVDNQEAKDTQIVDAMRSYAQDGYKLIIGHGYEYNEPANQVAADFPDVVFVSSSGGKTSTNAGAFRFYLEQAFYIAGYVGALSSKTGKLAMIGGPDVPSIRSTFKAFVAGAKAAKPTVEVKEIFTGENNDAAKAKQAALAAIAEGADFLIHQANAGATGVFDACKEKNVMAFGANLDQNNEPAVVGSALINAAPAFLALAKRVQADEYKGEVTLMGMSEGAVEFKLNPAMESKLVKDVASVITKLNEDIKSGKLVVPKDEF